METDQTQHPTEALGQPEQINNEAIDREPLVQDQTYQEPVGDEPVEEDPDAWRVLRVTDDPSEIYSQLNQLAERSEAFKRTLGSFAGRGTSAKLRQVNIELAAELEAEREARKREQLEFGNMTWGRMNQQQVAQLIAQNPDNARKWQEYNNLRQQYSQPKAPDQPWLRTMVADAQEYVEEVAHTLHPQIEQNLRQMIANPELYREYLDKPHRMMADLKEAVAVMRANSNNAGIQAGTTPRQPAPVNNGSGSRPVLAGNPRIGNGPDQTPPRRTSGGTTRYSRADIANMPQAQYEELKKLHGVETVQGLVDAGVVV